MQKKKNEFWKRNLASKIVKEGKKFNFYLMKSGNIHCATRGAAAASSSR